jgi:hypothetical protein
MSHNLRSTSYFGNHLDRELTKRGAHTSGSTERKQVRLQRFMDIENLLDWEVKNNQSNLRQIIADEQGKVRDRSIARATELIFEAVRSLILEKGLENSIPDVREIMMNCSPEVLQHIRLLPRVAAAQEHLRSTR